MGSASTKKSRREEVARQQQSGKRNKIGLIALLLAVALGFGGWFAFQESDKPGQFIESMGRTHLGSTTIGPRYNSSPPTSGPHTNPARWGENASEIPHVNQVHNLEHGGILIQYNCEHNALQDQCHQVRQELRTLLRTARDEIDPKIILAPYKKMEHPIALTAWTRVQYLAEPDQETILRFIRGNINSAPEQVE